MNLNRALGDKCPLFISCRGELLRPLLLRIKHDKQLILLYKHQWFHAKIKKLKENNNPKPLWNFVKSASKGTINNLVFLLVDGLTLTYDLSIVQIIVTNLRPAGRYLAD